MSNREIGREIGITLHCVQYHTRKLEKLGLIKKEFITSTFRYIYLTEKEKEILPDK